MSERIIFVAPIGVYLSNGKGVMQLEQNEFHLGDKYLTLIGATHWKTDAVFRQHRIFLYVCFFLLTLENLLWNVFVYFAPAVVLIRLVFADSKVMILTCADAKRTNFNNRSEVILNKSNV